MEVATYLQPHEPLTVKELSELFKMSRQAMSQHVSQLEKQHIGKNARGYKVIYWSGVLQLARKLGREDLLLSNTEKKVNTDITVAEEVATRLLPHLTKQLKEKDKQIDQLHALLERQTQLLDQQQQLTLQSNKRIEQLEAQLQIGSETSEEKKTSAEEQQTDPDSVQDKKWWHFLKK